MYGKLLFTKAIIIYVGIYWHSRPLTFQLVIFLQADSVDGLLIAPSVHNSRVRARRSTFFKKNYRLTPWMDYFAHPLCIILESVRDASLLSLCLSPSLSSVLGCFPGRLPSFRQHVQLLMAIVFHLFLINMFFFFVYFRHSEESSAPRITKISQKSL